MLCWPRGKHILIPRAPGPLVPGAGLGASLCADSQGLVQWVLRCTCVFEKVMSYHTA